MAPRKPKVPSITDMRVVQQWKIQPDENGQENYTLVGWEFQIQRGTDEWEKLDIENVIIPDAPQEAVNG